jgi:hypothetical protein
VTTTQGKGRPTPKRRDAEKNRRQTITAPRDRKEASRAYRDRQAKDRTKAREGMAKGDERYFPKRDQGPVRALARDFVDSRRTLLEYFMYLMIIVLLASFALPSQAAKAAFLTFGWPVLLVIMVGEGSFIGIRVSRMAKQRFPDQTISGKSLGWYAASRAMQIRRFRVPPPRLKAGQRDQV